MNRSVSLFLGGLIAVLAVVAGIAVDQLIDLVWVQVFVVVILEVVIFAVAVVIRPEKRLPILCDPVILFVAFQAQFFVIGPLALPYTGSFNLWSIPEKLVVSTVLAFIALLAMFLVGYHLPLGTAIAARLPGFDGASRKLPGRWIERGLLVICLGFCAGYVAYQGGIQTMLSRGYGISESPAFFIAPFLLLLLTTFLIGWRVFASATRTRGAIVLFVGLVAFETVFWGMLLGQRKWLFHLFFGLSAIFLMRRGTRAMPRYVLPTVLVALIFYLAFWGTIRGRPLAEIMQGAPSDRYAEMESLHAGYFDSVAGPFSTACLVLHVFPEREPFRYGETLLVGLLSPIPRAIWPEKPIALGKELTWYLGTYFAASYDTTKGLSITPTLVGDFYANLGIVGVLLGGFVFGTVCRVVASYAVKGMQGGLQLKPARVLIPAVFMAGLVEVRAEAAMLIVFYMYTMLPLLLLLGVFSFEADNDGTRDTSSHAVAVPQLTAGAP